MAVNRLGLVLGGGGVTGIAWAIGLICGLHDEGVDLVKAHRIIGTSAGSTVGAQITSGVPLDDLFERQVNPAKQANELSPTPEQQQSLMSTLLPLMNIENEAQRVRRFGELALASKTVDEASRRAAIESRLPNHRWSDLPLSVVAIDAVSGAIKVFDRQSGVTLVDAVAASCAIPGIWPCVTIDGHRYMDGGVRTADNADLARGCTAVLVISPMGMQGNAGLARHVEVLAYSGALVHVIEPDPISKRAMGLNALDPQRRAPAAQAGRQQGRAVADAIAVRLMLPRDTAKN